MRTLTVFLALTTATTLTTLTAVMPLAHALDAEKARACDQIVAVYNRCAKNLEYDRAQNLIRFPKLKTSVKCDDGLTLPFNERLNHADLSSTLSLTYTPGRNAKLPETRINYSPGGIRVDDVFRATYGPDEQSVRKNLVQVEFLGHPVKFNKMNGAATALQAISGDLLKLYAQNKDQKLVDFLKPFIERKCTPQDRCLVENGTFSWRVVAGTTRPSAHSFGTAIDLEPASGHEYWLWDVRDQIKSGKAKIREGADPKRFTEKDVENFTPMANPAYPLAMVEVFEKHGFIWGGKWYRYDVMHFEYRPEFYPGLRAACP